MRISRLIGVCIAALGFCFSGFGFATEMRSFDYALHVLVDSGSYGAVSAKFEAELKHAVAMDSVLAAERTGLLTDGHGFLQARADATVGQGVGNQVSLS